MTHRPALLALTCLTGAALMGAALPAAAEIPPPSITVSGEASVSAPPDAAEIEGGVTTEAKTAREASEANARIMNAVIAALKAAGVAEKDIRTARISIYPQTAPARNDPPRPSQIVGYRAGNSVTIRLRDIAKVAETLDALVAAGANTIGGIQFIISNPSPVLDRARANAVKDARRKAEIYAAAAGVTLGKALAISEAGALPPPPVAMRAMAPGAAASIPVAPGEQTLHVTLSVTWEIK
jgi:uncharacterized protein YggE